MKNKNTDRAGGGLHRWALLRPYWVNVGDGPFLKRLIVFTCPYGGLTITKIYQPDGEDRDPHSHFRTFASFVANGGYTEKVYTNSADLSEFIVKKHGRFSVHVMKVNHAHVITEVRKPLWTVVLLGRDVPTWHFWTKGGLVDWKDYG